MQANRGHMATKQTKDRTRKRQTKKNANEMQICVKWGRGKREANGK